MAHKENRPTGTIANAQTVAWIEKEAWYWSQIYSAMERHDLNALKTYTIQFAAECERRAKALEMELPSIE